MNRIVKYYVSLLNYHNYKRIFYTILILEIPRKSRSETNTKAAICYYRSAIPNLIYICKLSQSLFYITALAIMQDFRNNEKKTIKNPLLILFCRNLCESLHFCVYSWSIYFAFLSCLNIIKLLKVK